MANKYFKTFNSDKESKLYKNIIKEMIENYGVNCYYVKRKIGNVDKLFEESSLDKFDEVFEITVYFENYDDWQGQGDLFDKFGITVTDYAFFLIEKEKFLEYSQGYEPKEGDLLYFPQFSNKIFEITLLETEESPHYHLQHLYTYKFKCRAFEYNKEKMETGLSELDDLNDNSNRGFDINQEIENQDDKVIDWDEMNPFLG